MKSTLSHTDERFADHGIAAAVSESRGAVATIGADDRPLILALVQDLYGASFRISLVVIDAATGQTDHYCCPGQENLEGTTYSLMLSARRRLYFMVGEWFFEFDVDRRDWTFSTMTSGTAMSFAEAPDGSIYAGLFPRCELVRYDPATKQWQAFGRLDPRESYPKSLAVADDGWAYMGIGTEYCNLVAFDPASNQHVQLIDEHQRQIGTAQVRRGTDGQVYGTMPGLDGWLGFSGGEAHRVESPAPADEQKAISWEAQALSLPGGRAVREFSTPDKTYVYVDASGEARRMHFDYESAGAGITSLAVGPGGKLHGSTMHPMHWFTFEPTQGQLEDLGAVPRIGGGNASAFAVVGDTIYAAAYARGDLFAYDTTRPWDAPGTPEGNPRLLCGYPEALARPRCMLRHPDGRHLLVGGLPGYGRVAGGMAIYNVQGGSSLVLENDQLLRGHSTLVMRPLPNGDVLGGTTVATQGGAKSIANQAALYRFDWQRRTISWSVEPFGSAREVRGLEIDAAGRACVLTDEAWLFVLHVEDQQVVHQLDLSGYGRTVRPGQALLLGPDGHLYVLLTDNLLRVSTADGNWEHLASLPDTATAGSAIVGGRLYYAAGPRLKSLDLSVGKESA